MIAEVEKAPVVCRDGNGSHADRIHIDPNRELFLDDGSRFNPDQASQRK